MSKTLRQLVTDYVSYLRDAGHRHKRIIESQRQLDLFTAWAESGEVVQLDQLSLDVRRRKDDEEEKMTGGIK